MRYFVIGDSDTVLGFSYASLRGRVAASREEALAALEQARRQPNIGVVVITEEIAALVRKELDVMLIEQARPLIVELPGPQGPSRTRRSLLSVITEAVGIRV
jgi:V/A-type H+-transporting ATPase subunit F